MKREPIYQALFNLLKQTDGIVTATRGVPRMGIEQDRANLPALFMIQRKEEPQRTAKGLPPKWRLSVDVIVMAATGDSRTSIAMSKINPLLDQIDAALDPQPGGLFDNTLGGLVSHCYLTGTTQIAEGLDSTLSAVVMEIEIVVPA
jgi:hypothetical protein